jgi:hypothetical protein
VRNSDKVSEKDAIILYNTHLGVLYRNYIITAIMLLGGIRVKQLTVLIFILLITILFSGCGIPDLPGPLGIPGL